MSRESDRTTTIHEQLSTRVGEDPAGPASKARGLDSAEERAQFWRNQFEQERERVAKLWVAYQDLKAQLEDERLEAEAIATEKAGETIATDESKRPTPTGGDEIEPEASSDPSVREEATAPEPDETSAENGSAGETVEDEAPSLDDAEDRTNERG